MSLEERTDELKKFEDSKLSLNVSRDDYESLPKIMKGLASWEVQYSSFVQSLTFHTRILQSLVRTVSVREWFIRCIIALGSFVPLHLK